MSTYDYTAYSSDDALPLGTLPLLVASGTASTTTAVESTITLTGTKVYEPVQGLDISLILQFTSGATAANTTLGEATAVIHPIYTAGADVYPDTESSSKTANYVMGAHKIDLTKGIMGETDQLIPFPTDMENGVSGRPIPTLHETDDYQNVFQVRVIGKVAFPFVLSATYKVTQSSGSGTTARAALWVVGE